MPVIFVEQKRNDKTVKSWGSGVRGEWNGERRIGQVPFAHQHLDRLLQRKLKVTLAGSELVQFLAVGRAGLRPLVYGLILMRH